MDTCTVFSMVMYKHTEFTILAVLKCTSSGIQCIHAVVPPHIVPELSHHPQRKLRAHEALAVCYSLLPPPSPRQQRTCFPPLSVCLGISYKRSHTTRGHWWLAPFTYTVFSGVIHSQHEPALPSCPGCLALAPGWVACVGTDGRGAIHVFIYLGHSLRSPGKLELFCIEQVRDLRSREDDYWTHVTASRRQILRALFWHRAVLGWGVKVTEAVGGRTTISSAAHAQETLPTIRMCMQEHSCVIYFKMPGIFCTKKI